MRVSAGATTDTKYRLLSEWNSTAIRDVRQSGSPCVRDEFSERQRATGQDVKFSTVGNCAAQRDACWNGMNALM